MKIGILLLLICIPFIKNGLVAQQMDIDSARVERTLKQVSQAFSNRSFSEFSDLLFTSEDYFEMTKLIAGKNVTNEKKINRELKKLNSEIENIFNRIIDKGETKGIDWTRINYEGWIGNSEEIYFNGTKMPKGFLVDCHLKISFNEKIFTIIGIQLWSINQEYKVYGEVLRGIFEVDLESFIFANDMYLNEMEENGY